MLSNLKNLKTVTTFEIPSKLRVASLTRKDCEAVPELLKYCQANGKLLDRFHIPEITPETYEEIAPSFATRRSFNLANLKYETASQYYIRKARVVDLADKLGVSPSFIDTTDYIWDEAYYTCYNFWQNVDEVDEAWKNDNDDYRDFSANKVYIKMDTRQDVVDAELIAQLSELCYTLIRARRAMLVGEVDKCLSFIDALSEFTDGFSQNCTAGHNATLRKYFNHFKEMFEDEVFVAFLEHNTDITVFAECAETHADFIETYARFMSKMYTYEEFMQQTVPEIGAYTVEIFESEYFNDNTLSGAYLTDVSEE